MLVVPVQIMRRSERSMGARAASGVGVPTYLRDPHHFSRCKKQ